MLEETVVKLKELVWCDSNFGHDALSFDRHSEHVLTDAFKVDNENHIIDMRHTRYEFYDDLRLAVFAETTAVIGDVKLILKRTTVTRNTHHVVDVNFGGIGQIDSPFLSELVGHFTKVYDIFTESEGGCHHVALERQG